MNAPDAFADGPDALDADPSSARRRALLDQQLERLDQITQAGMDMVRALAAQVAGTGPKVIEGDVALAYSRLSRAVRMAILLQSRLVAAPASPDADEDPEDDGYYWVGSRDFSPKRVQHRKDLVGEIVKNIARSEGGDAERVERIGRETAERLERDDIYGEVHARPVSEIVADICRDLGLTPDWPTLAKERWVQVERITRNLGAPLRAMQRGRTPHRAASP